MDIIQVEHIMATDPAHARADHDPKYDHGTAFVHGEYCSVDEAAIPITDTGFIHADAAYDVVSASKGYIFRLDDHIERFETACEKFRLRNPYSRAQTAEILTNLVKLGGMREAYIWWCVTRGPTPESGREDAGGYENRFYSFVTPYFFIADDKMRTRGMDLMISTEHIRIPPEAVDPTAKNFHWMDMKLSLFEAADRGHDWSVLCDADGYLAEAPGANIFFIKNGVIFTPDSGCLEGITRQTTVELATEINLGVTLERVHADQLREADEAFLTSTAGGVMPINRVDGRLLGGVDGPGELTTRLHNLYWEKRWDGWLGTRVDFDEPVRVSVRSAG